LRLRESTKKRAKQDGQEKEKEVSHRFHTRAPAPAPSRCIQRERERLTSGSLYGERRKSEPIFQDKLPVFLLVKRIVCSLPSFCSFPSLGREKRERETVADVDEAVGSKYTYDFDGLRGLEDLRKRRERRERG